jgi:tetratricopeptide (TPR) repeat protein
MALVKLGRKKEAGATIEAALAKDPDNAVTHANQGWALLERGDHRKALEHFREALRLDPELDWARAGIVESLKARYLVYRLMLRYFLWMASLRARAQWALIIGLFVLYWVLRHVADANPDLAPWIWPVLYAYIGFAVMGWLADPLFNLLLRLNRFGRLALSPDQVRASNWVGGCLLVALLALGAWLVTGYLIALGLALNAGLLIIPIAATFRCEAGWPRDWMAIYTSVLAVLGAVEAAAPHVTIFLMVAADLPPGTARQILYVLLWTFLGGVILSEWVANGLMSIRPKL